MLIKNAKMKIESSSVIDRDMLLFGSQKKAFIKHDIGQNLIHASNSLDIVAELKDREPSEWIVFRARAIDAGGCDKTNTIYHGANDNGDYFSEQELLEEYEKTGQKSYETFINVPMFTNHQNGDIEKARGKVVSAFYDLDNHCVYTDCLIDAKAYPALARGIREGYINDVSMGSLNASSKVLMSDGLWKRHEDLVPGDCVITHSGQIQPITMISRTNEKTDCIEVHFVGQSNPLKASHDHPIFAIKKEQVDCIYADKKSICTPLGSKENKQCLKRNCDYSRGREEKNYSPEFINSESLSIGDYLLTPIDKWIDVEDKNADIEFSTILGYYLAEGNLKPTTQIAFNFHTDEKVLHEDLIKSILLFCNRQSYEYRIKIREVEEDHRYEINVYSKKLYNLLAEFSDGTAKDHNKRIKALEVFKWNKEARLNLIGKLIDGDGCNVKTKEGNGNSFKFYTSSEILADQVQDLCLSCGIVSRKGSLLRDKWSKSSLVKSIPNREYYIQIGNFDTYKFKKYSTKYKEKNTTRTMLSNRRFIWNGFLCSPVVKIEKYQSDDWFYHIEVGGNEDMEIDKLSDHSYIADGIAVHNCSVKWSECSVCKNKAVTEKDFCVCVKDHKGKMHKGAKVFEKNHGIKFIELSAVTDGACENCTIQNAYSGEEFLKKLEDNVSGIVLKACGDVKENILKYKKSKANSPMIKTARGEDVDKLNKALDNLREVADQILNSKAVDFEFLEKIGSLLADLQELIVDLVEAGFANEAGSEEKGGAPAPEGAAPPAQAPPTPTPGAPEAAPATTAPAAAMPGMPSVQTQIMARFDEDINMGKNNSKELKELFTAGLKIKEIIDGISIIKQKIAGGIENMPTKKQLNRMSTSNAISEKFAEILDERLSENDPIVISDGPYSIKIDPDEGISGFVDNKFVIEASNEELGEDLVTMAKINPQVVAGRLIQVLSNKYNENGELKMTKGAAINKNIIREALITNAPPVEQVQEGQLNDLSGNFDRKNDPVKAEGQVGATTQKQLDNVPKSKETGKGDWGRVRPDGVKENLVVTEGQLDDPHPTNYGAERKNNSTAVAKDQLGQVHEGQLGSYNDAKDGGSADRWHDASTPGDYLPLTEAQFEGKDRLGKAVDELQEGQLESRRQGNSGFAGSTDASPHTASKEERIVSALINGLANTVLARRISAKSLVSAKAGLSAPKSKTSDYRFAGKTNWSVDEIRAVAQLAIVEELKSVGEFDGQDVEEALSAIYEVPETLEASISNTVQEKIAELSNIQDVKTVEENKKASYLSALKKAAFKKEAALIHLSPENLRQLLGNGFSLNKIKDVDLEAKLSQLNPGVDFFDFSKAADGGWNIHSTKDIAELSLLDQDGGMDVSPNELGNNRMTENPEIPSMDSGIGNDLEMSQEPMSLAASKIAALKKLAQSPAGTTMPPPGGAGGVPPTGGAPGMESLTTAPPMEDSLGGEDELGDDDGADTDGEPKPFGSICPKCGAEDVDEIEGRSKCNSCGTEFETEINIKILNETDESEGEDDELGDDESLEPTEGENINDELAAPAAAPGGAAPGGAGAPPPGGAGGGMPGLAHSNAWLKTSYKIDPMVFVKNSPFRFASVGKEVAPGHRCISCGTTRVAFKESNGHCLKCGNNYSVAISKSGKDVIASIYWTPNLTLKEEPTIVVAGDGSKLNLGHATKGPVLSAKDVKKILHEILSSRDNMIKTASAAQNVGTFDDMMVCQLDQCGRGYASGEARTICAAIKDSVISKIAEGSPFGNDDDDDEEDDNVDFEKDKIEDAQDNFSNDEDEDEDEDEDFEDDGFDDDDDDMEEVEDDSDSDSDNGFGEESEDEFVDDVPGEIGGESDAPKVQKIELYMEDKDGNQFEVEYDVSGIEPNTAEGPEDFDMSVDEEIGEDNLGEEGFGEEGEGLPGEDENGINGDDVNEVVIEEEFEDPSFSIKDLFAPKGDEAALLDRPKHDHKEMPMDDSSVMALASKTSELLKGSRVASSNRSGGNDIDIYKVAQSLGISMPNDTQADVPRNKEQGIREDGEVVSTHDHPNTAKKMADGKHRGSAYTDKDQAIDRGVEVITPKSGRHAGLSKKAEEDTIKPTPSGSKENHASPDGSDQTPNCKGNPNEERKGDGHVKEKSNASEPSPAGDDDNHAVEAGRNPYTKEAGSTCKKCKKAMKKCACGMMKKKTKVEPKKDDKKKKKAGQDNWMKVAQSNSRQSEPIDAISDDKKLDMTADSEQKLDVPRNKAKAKPETKFERPKGVDNPVDVRKKEYGFGDKGKNLHTEVVPRDGSGDGLGGKSVSFEDEKGVDATSGNPDTYVQEFQKNVKATPAGNEDNHATKGPNTASDRVTIRKVATKECSSCNEERCPVCKGCECKNNKCKCN